MSDVKAPATGTPAQPPPAPAGAGPAAGSAVPPAPQFAPAPQGMVNVLVDGQHVVVPANDNLIEAARKVGKEIPYFCYHPRLSIAGQCRLCLVETSQMPGRLVPGCQVRVAEGMAIKTDTPAIKDNQRAIMEFHLVNHPVDCPICDQSGECKLQDYYVKYDNRPARIATYKLSKPKRKILGPLVVYDGERCILCTRCVRFMREIALEPQLAQVGRGDHSEIDTAPGHQLDSKYSGNTVDVCPVGALLNRDFRFTTRVWYLDNRRSVCAGCANGCNVAADSRADQVYRLLPKRNEEVNQVWLCDDGRVSYHRTNDERVAGARVGRGVDGQGEWPTKAAAVEKAAETLKSLAGKGDLAVMVSALCSTEEAFAAMVFARDVLKTPRVYAAGRAPGYGDDFLIREDKNPNRNGLKIAAQAAGVELLEFDALLGAAGAKVRHLVAFGAEVPVETARAVQAFAKLDTFVAFAANATPVTEQATLLLPLATHHEFEGTFVNWYGRLQRFRQACRPHGDALSAWGWVTALSGPMGAAWAFASAGEAFSLMAVKVPALAGMTLEGLPDTGLVLPGMLPQAWPKRAPRPPTAVPA